MNRRRNRTGFTLVEIMIVLAILVLLVAMVGPRLLKTQEKADNKITQTQIDGLGQALDFYKVDNRTFPTTEEGLAALISKPADENRSRNWAGPYLEDSSVPVDPWGNAYRYEYPGTRSGDTEPNIWSLGPDAKDNTADDIVSWTKSTKEDGKKDNQNLAASN
ncbi:MAG: type II secretion system major pseudopilin GspG [Planctomycetaceae bacterium]|nr:type II secretion system major pseudopilin GspG [Planctomycetaceae bacterium]